MFFYVNHHHIGFSSHNFRTLLFQNVACALGRLTKAYTVAGGVAVTDQPCFLLQEIVLNNERNGRPILIGTANVKMSEAIVSRLREAGVEPQLLNARPESIARENETISQAGGGASMALMALAVSFFVGLGVLVSRSIGKGDCLHQHGWTWNGILAAFQTLCNEGWRF